MLTKKFGLNEISLSNLLPPWDYSYICINQTVTTIPLASCHIRYTKELAKSQAGSTLSFMKLHKLLLNVASSCAEILSLILYTLNFCLFEKKAHSLFCKNDAWLKTCRWLRPLLLLLFLFVAVLSTVLVRYLVVVVRMQNIGQNRIIQSCNA